MTFEGRREATANWISIDTELMSGSEHSYSDPGQSGASPPHIQLPLTFPAACPCCCLDAKILSSSLADPHFVPGSTERQVLISGVWHPDLHGLVQVFFTSTISAGVCHFMPLPHRGGISTKFFFGFYNCRCSDLYFITLSGSLMVVLLHWVLTYMSPFLFLLGEMSTLSMNEKITDYKEYVPWTDSQII